MITKITVSDRRFPLKDGAGADSIHTQPVYAYAVCELNTDDGIAGIGLAFTLGHGNDLVCRAITALAEPLIGRDIETLMAEFGNVFRSIADNQHYRWLGPHEGVVHLVLVNHIAFGLEKIFLEYIPQLREHFVHPAKVESGVYHTPQEPGSSSDFS